jgi:hypothetical protein
MNNFQYIYNILVDIVYEYLVTIDSCDMQSVLEYQLLSN